MGVRCSTYFSCTAGIDFMELGFGFLFSEKFQHRAMAPLLKQS
jgi:hypothetical protein